VSRDKEIIIGKGNKRIERAHSTRTHFSARSPGIDLNGWHHAIHQVTGDMALRFNRATPADLQRWSRALHKVAEEMEAVRINPHR
jgi:hypothetical protein